MTAFARSKKYTIILRNILLPTSTWLAMAIVIKNKKKTTTPKVFIFFPWSAIFYKYVTENVAHKTFVRVYLKNMNFVRL